MLMKSARDRDKVGLVGIRFIAECLDETGILKALAKKNSATQGSA